VPPVTSWDEAPPWRSLSCVIIARPAGRTPGRSRTSGADGKCRTGLWAVEQRSEVSFQSGVMSSSDSGEEEQGEEPEVRQVSVLSALWEQV
jgi:hypothetical protein